MKNIENKKKLLVISHAPSPNTKILLEAVLIGANSTGVQGVEVVNIPPLSAGPDDVISSTGLILGTTENLGYMSGALKDFFDRIYYPCLEQTQGLPFALYIRAGHDGTGTRRATETITTGLRWKMVQEPLILQGDFSRSFVHQCQELGMAVGVRLDTGMF